MDGNGWKMVLLIVDVKNKCMKVIHKQKLEYLNGNKITLTVPSWCEVLSVDFQGADLVLWYITDDPFDLTKAKTFYVFRTGERLNFGGDAVEFVGTAYDRSVMMPFVLHVFKVV